MGNAVNLGGVREVLAEISDTNFSFWFRVVNVTKPIVSAEGLFQPGCSTVISKTGGRHVITPNGQTNHVASVDDRERIWLKGRIDIGGELVAAQDSGDEQEPEAASSSNRTVWPMRKPWPEQQENR